MSAAPLLDEAGGFAGTICLVTDISEVKRLTDEAAAEHRRFESILAHTNDIITVMDAELRLVYRSPAAARILGASRGVVGHGEDLFDTIHPADRQRVRDALAPLLEHET